MHKENFEVLWFNSKFGAPRNLPFQYHVHGVHIIKMRSQRQEKHPSSCKQPLHLKEKDNL